MFRILFNINKELKPYRVSLSWGEMKCRNLRLNNTEEICHMSGQLYANYSICWIKMYQLDVTCFIISLFNAHHFLNVSTSIFRSLRLIVDLFHVLYCSGSMCVGVVSLCRLKHFSFSLHKDTTPPQPNQIVTPTHIEPEQYNTWNKSTISRNLLKMDVLTSETCWAVNSETIKQATSSWSTFIQLSRWCTVQYT